ncbi:PEP/pyruvate-binding domain-containing protein [Methanofollis tationis]|uniref:pyruvate, water dikinase n=1 Tax=Methanofollis tationis TaxID=81417 RepID=A0A7K4HR99_9EURY|nr:PEP/pyruvate-binding domain-containing protein [Methanofollis tationis]NVO67400.1 hypothetical protein [Methanofollis tationis]
MNEYLAPLEDLPSDALSLCGGKALNLGRLMRSGIRVPPGICVTTDAYSSYIDETGIRGRIILELARKDFRDMRWEEVWDAALRIRTLFSRTPLPPGLHDHLAAAIGSRFGERPIVVRSSSVAEDSVAASFAGIHESFVNIGGVEVIIDHIRLVWTSLWSDAALLYRQEIGLEPASSAMAVVLQEIVVGESSGILFTVNPLDEDETIIEAVWGLNQGLVDGAVEPDRWVIDRRTGQAVSHQPPSERGEMVVPVLAGVAVRQTTPDRAGRPPLTDRDIRSLLEIGHTAEEIFGAPQDIEWTKTENGIVVLQARPVTARERTDRRQYYLGLKRSRLRLRALQQEIEGRWLPGMIEEGQRLAETVLLAMDDQALAAAIQGRQERQREWEKIYLTYFIPFAHGVRLFGTFYNDTVHPADPYEFVDLLVGGRLISLERNRDLTEMAAEVRLNPAALNGIVLNTPEDPLNTRFSRFLTRYGGALGDDEEVRRGIIGVIREMASGHRSERHGDERSVDLRERFLSHVSVEGRADAEELLALARRSYELRDNDNHALDRIVGEVRRAVAEGRKRLHSRGIETDDDTPAEEVARALRERGYVPGRPAVRTADAAESGVQARQITGQPASRGAACGPACVIRASADLFRVKSGDVLVCDAIEPGMTFVIPLCAAVVERRGGMLIHGAIIAREYGIPCVTGIPRATGVIRDGEQVCVDGYQGIVTIRHPVEPALRAVPAEIRGG